MGYSFFKSIRTKLLLLVLISILPAIGIVIYSGLERRYHDIEDSKDNTLSVVQSLAYEHEYAVESTRQLLMALSRHPEIQKQNVTACNKLLSEVLIVLRFLSNTMMSTIIRKNSMLRSKRCKKTMQRTT